MIGLVSISFRELSGKELVDVCVKNGIDAIEWGADVHAPATDLQKVKELKAYCVESGISCPSYGSYYHIGVPTHEGNVEFSTLLEAAKILEAKTIRIWPSKTASADASPEFLEECVEELKKICSLAEKKGISLAFEYHWNTLTDTAESTLDLIKKTGAPNLKTYWQPNYNRTPPEHLDEIKLLKGHIANVHTYFWDGRTRLPFSEGETVWRSYIGLLKDHDVPFMFEHLKDDSLDQLRDDTVVLKKLLNEVGL